MMNILTLNGTGKSDFLHTFIMKSFIFNMTQNNELRLTTKGKQ